MKHVTFCKNQKSNFSFSAILQRLLFLCVIVAIGLSSCEEESMPEPQPEPTPTVERKNLDVLDWPKALEDCITDAEKKAVRNGTKTSYEVWNAMKKRCPNVEKYDNGYLLSRLAHFPNAALVSSKHDLKAELCKFADNAKCCIDTLTIMGHGTNGKISVGDGQVTEECKYINGNTEDWLTVLEDKLKKALCDSAVIFLNGCDVGSGEKGLKKMQFIANRFNATVIAPTRCVYGNEDLDDLGDDIRIVRPGDTSTDNKTQEETDKKSADKKGNEMQPNSQLPLQKEIIALGIYPPNYDAIPTFDNDFALPIHDPTLIQALRFEAFNLGYALLQEMGDGTEASAVWVIAYEDGTIEVAHNIFSNYLFAKNTSDGTMYFQVNAFGRQLIQQAMELSVN